MSQIDTPTSRIAWPRPSLAGCTFAIIVRDTRGVRLSHEQRFNFFPASPLCAISWVLAGDCHLIASADEMKQPWTGQRMPAFAFSGAQLGPLVSWNPGETHVVTAAFYPDAFAALSGVDLSEHINRTLPADDVLPAAMAAQFRDLFADAAQGRDEASLSGLEDAIEALWTRAQPKTRGPIKRLHDWATLLAGRAAHTGTGRSARQIARRVKSWTGLNARDLTGFARTEQLYANMSSAAKGDDIDWAAVAAESGFADQAHMIRRLRRDTGFTPEQLRQIAPDDEALWGYRLLAQYFTQPGQPISTTAIERESKQSG